MASLKENPSVTTPADGAARHGGRAWLLVALVLAALNLRAPISAVSALLQPIKSGLGLSGVELTLLSMLPTVCLAAFAFAGPALLRRLGEMRLVSLSLFVLLAGDLVRMAGGTAALYAGTVLVAAAIGAVNGIVPGLIKREFPRGFVPVTALYTIVLTLGAAGASAFAPPLRSVLHSGWTAPLAVITVPVAVLGCAVWLPGLRRGPVGDRRLRIPAALWRDALAWQVTAFLGFMGLSFYFVLAWLPTVCHDRGMSVGTGGLVLSVTALIQVAGSLGVPVLVRRSGDQRGLAVAVAVLNAAGAAALFLLPMPAGAWIAAVLLGLAQGSGFSLALSLIGLRAPDAGTAAALSGMAQGVGYLIAIAGPLGGGLLLTSSGGRLATLALLLVISAGELVAGLGAGRRRFVPSAEIDG